MGENIRFSELVRKFGNPHAATLWTDPSRDSSFKKAVKENRVLTVKQENVGSKKDFGTVGFQREENVSYLIFPRPLFQLQGARVIGIKYEMLRQPKIADPISIQKGGPENVAKSKPALKEFCATVKRTAVWETTIQTSAKNKTEAKTKIARALAAQKFSDSDAVVRNEIRALDNGSRHRCRNRSTSNLQRI